MVGQRDPDLGLVLDGLVVALNPSVGSSASHAVLERSPAWWAVESVVEQAHGRVSEAGEPVGLIAFMAAARR